MAGLLDPTDDIVSPDERKAITQQNLFSTLLQSGMGLVAAGENIYPWQRAQMIAQAAQPLGAMPANNQQMLANAAQMKLRGLQGQETRQKLQSQKEWETTLNDPAKMQAFIGGLPLQYRDMAIAQLKAQGPAAVTQIMQHANDMEMKGLQVEALKREAARQAQWSQIMTGQGGGGAAQQPTPVQLPGFQHPGQQAPAGGGDAPAAEPPPPQSVLRLTPAQQALTSPPTAPQQPFQPLTMNDVINGMNPAQRAALAAMKPDVGVGKLFELANQNDKVAAWDSVAKQAVFVPKNMPPNNRFVPMDAEKMRVEAEKFAQSQRNDLVGPSGINQQAIDAKAAATKAEAEARAGVEHQYKGNDKLTELALKDYQQVRSGAVAAVADKQVLEDMEALLNGGIAAGPMVDTRMMGGRIAEYLGLGNMPDSMVKRELFNNLVAQRVINIAQGHALGSGNAVSNSDRELYEKSVGAGKHLTDAELRALLKSATKYADKRLENHAAEAKRVRTLVPTAPEAYFAIESPQRSQQPPLPSDADTTKYDYRWDAARGIYQRKPK